MQFKRYHFLSKVSLRTCIVIIFNKSWRRKRRSANKRNKSKKKVKIKTIWKKKPVVDILILSFLLLLDIRLSLFTVTTILFTKLLTLHKQFPNYLSLTHWRILNRTEHKNKKKFNYAKKNRKENTPSHFPLYIKKFFSITLLIFSFLIYFINIFSAISLTVTLLSFFTKSDSLPIKSYQTTNRSPSTILTFSLYWRSITFVQKTRNRQPL